MSRSRIKVLEDTEVNTEVANDQPAPRPDLASVIEYVGYARLVLDGIREAGRHAHSYDDLDRASRDLALVEKSLQEHVARRLGDAAS